MVRTAARKVERMAAEMVDFLVRKPTRKGEMMAAEIFGRGRY